MLKPLAVLAVLATISAPAALACSCGPCDTRKTLLESQYVDAAFVGELLSVHKTTVGDFATGEDFGIPQQHELIYIFKVTGSLKGNLRNYVMVRSYSDPAACGAYFGFELLNAVAVSQDDTGKFHASYCAQMCWGAEPNRSLIPENTYQNWRDPFAAEE